MLPSIKRKWLEALRSGKYKQGQMALCQVHIGPDGKPDEFYCCLGVLAEVTDNLGTGVNWRRRREVKGENGAAASLPFALLMKFGMTEEQHSDLVRFNDDNGWPFTRIADWIEENL